MKVGIVGGGVSGLAALWALQDSEHEVHLHEASSLIGGHANTAVFEHEGRKTDVDTGFIVFNETNYRMFKSFLRTILRRHSLFLLRNFQQIIVTMLRRYNPEISVYLLPPS